MRSFNIEDLHDGMICGLDVKLDNHIIIPKGTVLTNPVIGQLASLLDSNKKVWVFDLTELKPILIKNSEITRNYISFLVNSFQQIFTTDLANEEAYFRLMHILEHYLYTNRKLLYETIVLRNNHCYTYEHSLNVALYSLIIGINEELTSDELKILVLGCAFHDLGKKNISNTILDSPNKLSDTEFKTIKQHPLYGIELADNLTYLDGRVKNIILQHHEKLDGTGYPFGLHYSKIDHLSRISAVADIFDAVTSKRSYHKERTTLEGIAILDNDVRNGKISADEVEHLIKDLVLYPINTAVVLSNGKSGYVIHNVNNRKPIVLTSDNMTYDLSLRSDLSIVKAM